MAYLLAGQVSELERLQLQARVWEPAALALLEGIDLPADAAVLDVGCGAMGWLRALHRKVAPTGSVVGTDIDARLLEAAGAFATAESLYEVELLQDDLFASRLPAAGFDLVHARFQLAPLGRAAEQVRAFARLAKPGGWLVLEEPDAGSWHVNPEAPATAALIELLLRAFRVAGGDFDAGRSLPALLHEVGVEPQLHAQVIALEPGHPYLRLPLQFANALRARLVTLAGAEWVATLLAACEQELARPGTWGTTFTLVQAWGRVA
jgi:SAM-dependent methyltransferase